MNRFINGKFFSSEMKQYIEVDKVISAGVMGNPQTQVENLIIFNMENSQPLVFGYSNPKEALKDWEYFCKCVGMELSFEDKSVIEFKKH